MHALSVAFTCSLILLSIFFSIRTWFHFRKFLRKKRNCHQIIVGFFHPYCNAGGGGERVLWTAICAVQNRYKEAYCVVYTGDVNATPEEILKKVELRFNIKLPRAIEFVYLRKRHWVEAKRYPFFTLLFQSLGSVFLGLEALIKFVPDIYIDTMGYAFTLPLFKFLGSCRVSAYIHYPTISTDMLQAVSSRNVAVNNRKFISSNTFLSFLKLIYYKIFALLYGFIGRQAEIIMVNSTWTKGHIDQLWRKSHCTFTVYPPCDVSIFKAIPLKENDFTKLNCRILSIAQFRPEKDHELQIKAFYELLKRINYQHNMKLVLVGSCRDEEDYQRVLNLTDLCNKLGLAENVEFKINLSFKEIIQEMDAATIALHTMWNEHFGIGVVECMSAGLVMIAHNSGGPKMDIVIDHNGKKTGFLANDVHSFADNIEGVLKMNFEEIFEITKSARDSVSRFSVNEFENSFLSATKSLFL